VFDHEKHELSCHIDFIRKTHLATLIEECKGDLTLIGHYWDHGSEKTLRNLIRDYDLVDLLRAARSRPNDSA
jgi:hypothetical protein